MMYVACDVHVTGYGQFANTAVRPHTAIRGHCVSLLGVSPTGGSHWSHRFAISAPAIYHCIRVGEGREGAKGEQEGI